MNGLKWMMRETLETLRYCRNTDKHWGINGEGSRRLSERSYGCSDAWVRVVPIRAILGDVAHLPTPPNPLYPLAHSPLSRLHTIAQDASKGVGAPLTPKTPLLSIQRL
jgi:hypothetical protein